MNTSPMAVRDAFPAGAWDLACLTVARHRLANWQQTLPNGDRLTLVEAPALNVSVRLEGQTAITLLVALDRPGDWWPDAAGWESSDWRDALLLQGLEPALDALRTWFPLSHSLQCRWAGAHSSSPEACAVSLFFDWQTGGEVRSMGLQWGSAAEALVDWWRAIDAQCALWNDDEPAWSEPCTPDGSLDALHPRASLRPCIAELHLTDSELAAVQAGGGIVLDKPELVTCPLWLRIGEQWALAGECRTEDSQEDAALVFAGWSRPDPDLKLPAIRQTGELSILGGDCQMTALELAGMTSGRSRPLGPDCEVWQGGRLIGRGTLHRRDQVCVLQLVEWKP